MSSRIVTDGLVAHWHAARADGGKTPGKNATPTGRWVDLSAGGHHLDFSGAPPYDTSNGWVGAGTAEDPYALHGTGVVLGSASDLLSVANLTLPDPYTIEGWYKRESATAGGYVLCATDTGTGAAGGVYLNGHTAYHRLGLERVGGYEIVNLHGGGGLANGTLYHTIAVVRCAAKSVTLYENGAKRTVALTYTPIPPNARPLRISRHPSGVQYFAGRVIAVRLYGRDLTDDEAAANYAAGYLLPPVSVSPINSADSAGKELAR